MALYPKMTIEPQKKPLVLLIISMVGPWNPELYDSFTIHSHHLGFIEIAYSDNVPPQRPKSASATFSSLRNTRAKKRRGKVATLAASENVFGASGTFWKGYIKVIRGRLERGMLNWSHRWTGHAECAQKLMRLFYTVFMRCRIHAFISRFQPIQVCINAISWIRQHTKVDYEFNLKAWNGHN